MTDKDLKQLKDNLWHPADALRAGAHLAANKYGQPILADCTRLAFPKSENLDKYVFVNGI